MCWSQAASVAVELGYSLFLRLCSPGAAAHSPVHGPASPPCQQTCFVIASAALAWPAPVGLLSAVSATALGLGSCSWEFLRPPCCPQLLLSSPAVPGIAGEIVPLVLCHTWEASSACAALGFIFLRLPRFCTCFFFDA